MGSPKVGNSSPSGMSRDLVTRVMGGHRGTGRGAQRGASTHYFVKMLSCFLIAHQPSLEECIFNTTSPLLPASPFLSKTHPDLHPHCPLGPSAKASPTSGCRTSQSCAHFPFSGPLHPPSSETAPSEKSTCRLTSFVPLVSVSLRLLLHFSQPLSSFPSYILLRVTNPPGLLRTVTWMHPGELRRLRWSS